MHTDSINEQSLGKIQIPRDDIHFDLTINSYPYDYFKEHNLFDDNIHSTSAGLREWLDSVTLKIDNP